MKEQLILEVKRLRLSISENVVMIGLLEKSRATALAATKAEEAFMFLGKVLESLGAPYPYPRGSNEASGKIEDTVEKGDVSFPEGNMTYLEMVKYVRSHLQGSISSTTYNKILDYSGHRSSSLLFQFCMQSLMNLVASKMWLGMEINAIVRRDKELEEKKRDMSHELKYSGPTGPGPDPQIHGGDGMHDLSSTPGPLPTSEPNEALQKEAAATGEVKKPSVKKSTGGKKGK